MNNNSSFLMNLKQVPEHLNARTISAGLLSGIFGITTSLIIIGAGSDAGLDQQKIISWIFSTFFFGALTGLILSIKFKQPIPGAWSIPGAALVAIALKEFSFAEMAGAYFVAGLLVFIVGASGLISRVLKLFPLPIVLAMIIGVLMGFGTGMIKAIDAAPLVSGSAILTYMLTWRWRDRFPPILIAFFFASIIAWFTGQFSLVTSSSSSGFIFPTIQFPEFSVGAILSVSVPLALLVICGEMPKAIGVLMSQGYAPPTNSITAYSGVGGMIVAFFGGTNVNIAGPMAAICASPEAGDQQSRYASVIVNAAIFGLFGLLASVAVPLVVALPPPLINTIAGLAMVNVLLTSLQSAFSFGRFQIGAFFSLAISLSGVNFLHIALFSQI